MSVLAARIIVGAWRELGAGYRRPAPCSAVPVPVPEWQRGGDGTFSVGREGFAPSFTSRPAVFVASGAEPPHEGDVQHGEETSSTSGHGPYVRGVGTEAPDAMPGGVA